MIRYKDGKVDRSNWFAPSLAHELADAIDSANSTIAAKEAEIVRLHEAIHEYGDHHASCGFLPFYRDAKRAALQLPTLDQESSATSDGADAARDSTIKAKE